MDTQPKGKKRKKLFTPTSIRFQERNLLERLDKLGEDADLKRRQLIELAVAKLVYDYERLGMAALVRPMPVKVTYELPHGVKPSAGSVDR